MVEETLYSVVRPLIVIVDLFGWHWRKEMSTGLKLFKLLSIAIFLVNVWDCFPTHLRSESNVAHSAEASICNMVYAINAFCLLLTLVERKALNQLIEQLKTISMTEYTERRLRAIKMILIIVFIYCITIMGIEFRNLLVKTLKEHQTLHFILLVIITGGITFLYRLLVSLSVFAPFLALFICCIAYYVKVSFEEALDELKRCQSMERKNRSMAQFLDLLYALNRLVNRANRIGTPLMLAIKATVVLLTALSIYVFVYTALAHFPWTVLILRLASLSLLFQYFIIYSWYLCVAPSVYNFKSMISKILLETTLRNEQVHWPPRLFETRLNQLNHLVQIHLEALINESVDETDIFTMLFDLVNNLNAFNISVTYHY